MRMHANELKKVAARLAAIRASEAVVMVGETRDVHQHVHARDASGRVVCWSLTRAWWDGLSAWATFRRRFDH